MKYLRWTGALALVLAILMVLPALAEGTLPGDPMDETSEAICGATGGEHQIADDAWVVSVEPSCMVGLRKGLCEACGLVYNEVIAATGEHSWDDGVETTAPTCETAGVKTYTCSVCGETKTEDIPAAGHSWDDGVETTAPTCETAGVKTYTCSVCGETKTEDIPAAGHSWDDGVETTAPTCETAGVKTYTCAACGETKTEDIPALDHDFSVEVTAEVPAACETEGTTAVMQCSRCTEQQGGEPIPAPGHTVTTWELVEKATCSSEGKETGVCDVCGETVEQAIPIDPVAHAFDEGVETAATCEVDGKVVYTCQLCGETQEVAIPAPGHAWDEGKVTTEATCTTDGVKTYTCAACGETKTETIPAAGHVADEGRVTKEATCTEDGQITYTCTVCGATGLKAIPARGHDWGAWKTLREATEDQPGKQERTCEVCGSTQTREVDYQGDMPKTGVFTVPTAWLVAGLTLSLAGYIALKRRSVRG